MIIAQFINFVNKKNWDKSLFTSKMFLSEINSLHSIVKKWSNFDLENNRKSGLKFLSILPIQTGSRTLFVKAWKYRRGIVEVDF